MSASLFQSPPQTLLQHQATSAVFSDRVAVDPAAPFPGRWRKVVSFFVPGKPIPGGSKTATVIRRKGGEIVMVNGRPLVTTRDDAKGNADWKQTVKVFARQAFHSDPLDGVFGIQIEFRMPRIKGHFGSGAKSSLLKASAPLYHSVKPDCTKLMRSTEDALTNVLWRDDATIGEQHLRKIYAAAPGAQITLWVLEDGGASC